MLHLQILGPPTLTEPDAAEPLPMWDWQTALLAYLAVMEDGTATRPVVAGLLWPDGTDRAARRSLRQALYRLRRRAGDILLREGDVLRLHPDRVAADVRSFRERLAADRPGEAIDVYRGELLEGFAFGGSAPFEQWVDGQRARLADRAAAAFEAAVGRATERANWPLARERAERWHRLFPFSEVAVLARMRIHARMRDRGRALEIYESFRERLSDALGLEPGRPVDEVAERIRRRAIGVSMPARTAHGAEADGEGADGRSADAGDADDGGADDEAVAGDAPGTPPLVGRSVEFERLSSRWARARGGQPQFVLVTGEPGIGKTRLAEEFLDWLELSGATVLSGRGWEVERTVPYAGLTGILRGALAAPGLAAVGEPALAQVSRIVPEFAARFRHEIDVAADDPEAGRIRLLDGVRAVVDELAYERPVALFVDDLPWCDDATLASLHYLWRTLSESPVLFLATARSADLTPETAAASFWEAIAREGGDAVDRFELPPLRPDHVEDLGRALGGTDARLDSAAAARLQRECGGNPLFLIETLRAGTDTRDHAPTGEVIRTTVRERVRRLSDAARALLRAAAVLGGRFRLAAAVAVAELDPGAGAEAAEELVSARLLRERRESRDRNGQDRGDRAGYEFTHDLLRRTVTAELGGARRELLHRRAFDRLAPADADAPVELDRAAALALHASGAGTRAEAYRWLLRASDLARRVYADAEAERFLERAVGFADTDVERTAVWRALGEIRRVRSDFSGAALAYLRALDGAPSGTRERLLLRIRALDAGLRAALLDAETADSVVEDLLADAREAGGEPLRELHLVLAYAAARSGADDDAARHAAAAVEAARAAGESAPLVRALLLHARLAAARGGDPEPLPLLDEAVRVAADDALVVERCQAGIERATELSRRGRWTDAVEGWRDALRRAEAADEMGSIATACVNLADILLRRGEWDAAGDYLERAAQFGDRYPHIRLDVLVNRALLCWHRGDADAADEHARRAAEEAAALELLSAERVARAVIVLARLDTGDAAGAEPHARRLETTTDADAPVWTSDRDVIATARARWARHARGEAVARDILETALAQTTDVYIRAALRLELAALDRPADPDRADQLAAGAAAVLRGLGAAPVLARMRGGVRSGAK